MRKYNMKLYNCPDCTHTEDTCENCTRYEMYYLTNFKEYNIQWPYQPTITFETQTFTTIPPACRNCPNHPSNGGSGNCNCILGDWTVIC